MTSRIKEKRWNRSFTLTATLLSAALPTGTLRAERPIIGSARVPLEKLPQVENFEVIAHNPLPNPGDVIARGRNGPVGIAGDCLYVGNRIGRRTGTGPNFGTDFVPSETLIVDIADPSDPQVVGAFQTILGATSRELRTIPDMNTLIILNFRDTDVAPDEGGNVNNYQIYDITDCRNPRFVRTIEVGLARPHEFFLWRDPNNPARFLIYSSISGGITEFVEPSLRVFELINPPSGPARMAASFTLTPAVPQSDPVDPDDYRDDHFVFTQKPTTQGNNLHSMSVSRDGTRVYMANSQAGYFILDSTLLALNRSCIANTQTFDEKTSSNPRLCLRKINPDPKARVDRTPPFGGIHHSIYPVPGRPYAVTGGERNGTTTCPWTPGQILDITDEKSPQVISQYMVPENLPENCFVGGPGDPALQREFSTHQLLIFPNIFFNSWYSAGLRAWDISIAALPVEVGVFVPRPEDQVVERFRNSPDVWTWPFPILHNGLIYIADENSGLYVLRYTGPRADELPQQGTFLSNTNF